MKKWILTIVIGSMLVQPAAASAQEPGRTFGLGIGLQPLTIAGEESLVLSAAPSLYVPFMVTENVMVEPSVGLIRVSSEVTRAGETNRSSFSVFRLGAGVLLMSPLGDDGRAYFGPRIGILRTAQSDESGTFDFSRDQIDLTFAGVAGGEFFLTDRFSLGGELGLEYVRAGDPDVEPEPTPEADRSGGLLRTLTELRVRWYFR